MTAGIVSLALLFLAVLGLIALGAKGDGGPPRVS